MSGPPSNGIRRSWCSPWPGPPPAGAAYRAKVLNLLLSGGFEGKPTTSKWAKLTRCSQDSASRDIQGLIEGGILVKDRAGGRSTSYSLNPEAFERSA